ncbi:MAG TPA: DUF4232 domain-containing protein [Acidimicrobiales bacterium]|nr:DUF4232 domain-containing protein [Acidimicrobiales bacterium]
MSMPLLAGPSDRRSLFTLGVLGVILIVACTAAISLARARHHGAPVTASAGRRRTLAGDTSACTASQLRVTLGPGLDDAHDAGGVVVFTNTGASPCDVDGYPTVTAFASGGSVLSAVPVLAGPLGGWRSPLALSATTLSPGDSAEVAIESPAHQPDGQACPTAAVLRVRPPGSPTFALLWATLTAPPSAAPVALPMCHGFAVHPFMPAGGTAR